MLNYAGDAGDGITQDAALTFVYEVRQVKAEEEEEDFVGYKRFILKRGRLRMATVIGCSYSRD